MRRKRGNNKYECSDAALINNVKRRIQIDQVDVTRTGVVM